MFKFVSVNSWKSPLFHIHMHHTYEQYFMFNNTHTPHILNQYTAERTNTSFLAVIQYFNLQHFKLTRETFIIELPYQYCFIVFDKP